MSRMLKSSGAMGAATLASRVLGMVREMVYARFMGDTVIAGAFQLAFTIPNLFRRLLGEGALTAAFIPIFKTTERTQGDAAMWRAANAVLSGLLVAGAGLVLVALALLSLLLAWWPFHEDTRLMLELLRVMFPYMLLVCLAATFIAMLNARGHFFVPALGAAMLNLVMIASVFFLAPRFGNTLETQIFGLAVGVLLAGLLQTLFQIPPLRKEGFVFHWITPWNNPTVRDVLHKMIPGTLGVAAFQLNVVVTQGMAYWIDPQIVASFNYGVRLMELPQGIFGISLATFLLPELARLVADKNYPEFRSTLRLGLGHLLAANLLASALLLVLAEPIIRLLFERGEFGPGATSRAAFGLACLAPGLVAFSTVNILARAFYALGDTQTPMKISSFCLLLNILAVLWLIVPFRQGGLGVANTLTSFVNVGLLAYALRRKIKSLEWTALRSQLPGILGGALAAGLIAWLAHRQWDLAFGHATLWTRLGAVFIPAGLATAAYAALGCWIRNPSILEMVRLAKNRIRPGNLGP